MTRSLSRSAARAAAAHLWQEALLGALRRSCQPRTVLISEYELHPAARYGWGNGPHGPLLDVFRKREADSQETREALTAAREDLLSIPGGRRPSGELTWDNDWWGGLDAMVLYVALRGRNPKRYVEIGSGYSTRFARRSISDHGLRTQIVSIDPQPRADIDELCDSVIRRSLEKADLSVFAELSAGDVVVVDGSHTVLMSSDTVVFFLEVLPALPPGILVAIDDIFLPWDYPPEWTGRWYGEQYLLATMLLSGADDWRLTFPAWYLTQESALRNGFEPLWRHIMPERGRYAMSFWMEKT